jgi:hypothetical protein
MIFMSYAREDSERANRIYSMINKPDRPVFYDKMALAPGMDWREEIERNIEKCKLFLVLCSRHSVGKEGFIQKEIRLALERSELMPDGRIFIVPIRFDEVDVPRKIARYQWFDVKDEADFYWIESNINLAWVQVADKTEESLDIELLKKDDITMLMQGKNSDGQKVFAYIKLSLFQLTAMKNAIKERKSFQPSDFGTVLVSGEGDPSEELRNTMSLQYGLVTDEQRQRQLARDEFIKGYREAYLGILGSDVVVPLVQPPDKFTNDSSPLREGIRTGMKEALKSLPSEDA